MKRKLKLLSREVQLNSILEILLYEHIQYLLNPKTKEVFKPVMLRNSERLRGVKLNDPFHLFEFLNILVADGYVDKVIGVEFCSYKINGIGISFFGEGGYRLDTSEKKVALAGAFLGTLLKWFTGCYLGWMIYQWL